MDMSLTLTIVFGLVSVVALLYAINEGKKAKKAENRIIEIEQAVVSYKYLKDKAYENYNLGRYEESLDVFRKYFLDNKDEKEWLEVITDIFKKETEKIFSNVLTFKESYSANMLIQAYISYEEILGKSLPYPDLLKKLYDRYKSSFKKEINTIGLLISILDKDWIKAKGFIKTYIAHQDKEIAESFRQFILKFIDLKIGKVDDGFADDIPF